VPPPALALQTPLPARHPSDVSGGGSASHRYGWTPSLTPSRTREKLLPILGKGFVEAGGLPTTN